MERTDTQVYLAKMVPQVPRDRRVRLDIQVTLVSEERLEPLVQQVIFPRQLDKPDLDR